MLSPSMEEGECVGLRIMKLGLIGVLLIISAGTTPGGSGELEKPIHAQHALGHQRLLILAVSFPDIESQISLSQIGEKAEKVAQFYAVASYGKTVLSFEIKGWYVLPRPLEDYRISPYNTQVDHNRVWRLVEDTFNLAEKEITLNQYDHVIIVVGVKTGPSTGYGMIAYSANPGMLSFKGMRSGNASMEKITTHSGQEFKKGIIVVAQNAHVGHIVHDLAHALGGVTGRIRPIPDLYDTVLQGKVGPLSKEAYPKFTVFMGPWDVMSRHFVERDKPPPGMSSFTRLRMGWIGDDQIVEVFPGDNRAVTLRPLGSGKGTLVIRIPARWGTYYLLENRQEYPGDAVLPATGLLVLNVNESREDGDGIVRVVDANPKVPDFAAATFGVGQRQNNPTVNLSRGVAATVLWERDKDLTVMVAEQSIIPEIQAVANNIRDIEVKLDALPKSIASKQVKAELATAKKLLLNMKVSDAKGKLDKIKWPQ